MKTCLCPHDRTRARRAGRARPWLRSAGILTVTLLFSLLLHGAEVSPGTNGLAGNRTVDFAIEAWRADNGIPQNTVTAVLQTRQGFIWAGTYNGVVQFDGLRFKIFDSANTKGLANSRITSLYEDTTGAVWIGHDNGELTRHAAGKFVTESMPSGWGHAPIKDFSEDEHGDFWVFNQLGDALRVKDDLILKPPPLMAQQPFANPCVVVDTKRHLFVVRNGVVARVTNAGYQVVDFGDVSERPYYAGAAAARTGGLWVAGQGSLRKWDGKHWTTNFGEPPWTSDSVTVMRETSTGRLLVGTLQSGLFVLDPAAGWFHFDRANGLPQNWVLSLAEDREQNLWVGTGGGLALLRERKVAMYNPPDDWQGRPVLSITRAADGAVWAATEGAGIYRFDGRDWSHFGTSNGLANLFVWAVLEDSQRQVWAGTWGGGLFRLENGRFVCQSNLVSPSDPVVALKEAPAGTLWIGTGNGLLALRNDHAESFARFGGAAAGDVRAIESGTNGDLWIGTQGSGLGHWQDGAFKTFRMVDGLAGNFILSLLCETNGTLWIGTLDQGLCRYQNGVFRTITTANGLLRNIIYHIEDDQLGHLWFNSPSGLYRVAKRELNACADGQQTNLNVLGFGKAEGMSTVAGTGGFTPSGFRAPDGRLWFSTARGIAVLDPQAARRNPISPPVWIEDVMVDRQAVAIGREAGPRVTSRSPVPGTAPVRHRVVVPPGRRQLDVQFTGLSFTAPERVQFKYRLEGLDADWTDGGTRRRVTYSFLPPGEYTFRVIACNSDGLWSETGDTLAITVQPHFWQTWWFKTLMIIAGVALLALIFFLESRRRLRRRLERIARERELERERARIAQDIHDDLGASLTRIGMLSESAAGDLHDPPRAAASLDQIYATSRELTRAMDEIVWAVNPRHDTLESLTNYISRFAQDFLRTAQTRCRLAMPLQVPELPVRSEVRHNLFLAFKEIMHNVVKHAQAREVRVSFDLEPGGFRLTIADDGVGYDPGRFATSEKDRFASGNGLANIRSRLAQIGGRCRIDSAPGRGTNVELFVPLAHTLTPAGVR